MGAKLERIEKNCPSCGAVFLVTLPMLDRGRGRYCSRSCGAKSNSFKHGHTTHKSQSKTYVSWVAMLSRCQNERSEKYQSYGAAGITVCEEWQDFANFLRDMGERPAGTTIDRINGSLGYQKGNCRWATPSQQSSNIKTNVWLDFMGESITIADLAKRLGISKTTLDYRIKAGWPENELGKKPKYSSRSSR